MADRKQEQLKCMVYGRKQEQSAKLPKDNSLVTQKMAGITIGCSVAPFRSLSGDFDDNLLGEKLIIFTF